MTRKKEAVYLDQVMAGDIIIDHERQRELVPPLLTHLRRNWDTMALGVIYLSKRGDRYHCMDGQHRVVVATELDNTTIFNALVFENLTPQRESELFIKFNEGRRSVSPYHKWVQHLGFEDPEYVEVEKIIHSHNLEAGQAASANRIACLGKLMSLRRKYDITAIDVTLAVLDAAWARTGESWRSTLVGAVCRLVYMNKQVDLEHLTEVLRGNEPRTWDDMRTGGSSGEDGDMQIAEQIAARYNRQKRGKNRLVVIQDDSKHTRFE